MKFTNCFTNLHCCLGRTSKFRLNLTSTEQEVQSATIYSACYLKRIFNRKSIYHLSPHSLGYPGIHFSDGNSLSNSARLHPYKSVLIITTTEVKLKVAVTVLGDMTFIMESMYLEFHRRPSGLITQNVVHLILFRTFRFFRRSQSISFSTVKRVLAVRSQRHFQNCITQGFECDQYTSMKEPQMFDHKNLKHNQGHRTEKPGWFRKNECLNRLVSANKQTLKQTEYSWNEAQT